MGLEAATYINGLNVAWPLAGDTKSQGDDHLRLIKSVLTATLPNASKPFYLPSAEAFSSTIVLDATDQNNIIMVDVTAGDVACTLPGTLGANDKGWSCRIMRTSSGGGTNGVVVSPTSGNIASAVGNTATIRIERLNDPVEFFWTGTLWTCVKSGPPIGSQMIFDGATVPFGYRAADGATLSTTTYPELNAALGTNVLRDKRGRVDIGVDPTNVNMSSTAWSGAVTLGSTKANNGLVTLVTANLPPYTPAGSNGTVTVTSNLVMIATGSISNLQSAVGGGAVQGIPISQAVNGQQVSTGSGPTFTGTPQGGTSASVVTLPPSIATNKLIRVC